jgi:hypothetical protein
MTHKASEKKSDFHKTINQHDNQYLTKVGTNKIVPEKKSNQHFNNKNQERFTEIVFVEG